MPAHNLLALDAGEARVGLAMARGDLRMPIALPTLERQVSDFWQKLEKIINDNEIGAIIVGLPRGLEGQETGQTRAVRAFGEELKKRFTLPIHWQDEALTSVKAESILSDSGKPYAKADIDALAASLILTDYIGVVSEAVR